MELVTRDAFDRAYDEVVLGRTFVEYKDYYIYSRTRFWKSFDAIQRLALPEGARALDIGGGILATLVARLLGFRATVCDVHAKAEPDIRAIGLEFELADVFRDELPAIDDADLVIFTEVIEHLPVPPHVVMDRLARLLRPGGYLFLTTPNGHQFRNLLRMAAGREILDFYTYPTPNRGLGHQHEYTMGQMRLQAAESSLDLVSAAYYRDGFKGATLGTRIGRMLARPADLVPYWRNGLMIVLRRPAGGTAGP